MSVEWEDAGMHHRVDRAAVESILKRMDAAIAVRNTAVADRHAERSRRRSRPCSRRADRRVRSVIDDAK